MNEHVLKELFENLKRKYDNGDFVVDKTRVKTLEETNVNLKGFDYEQRILDFGSRKTPSKYVAQELRWYDSKDLNINGYVDDIEIWQKVSDKDGFVNSNYGWCIYSPENHKQYDNALSSLMKNKETRQSSMIYTRPSMHYDAFRDGMSDFMCTNNTQHFIRNNVLDYIVNQRSMDLVFGLFNDLPWHQEVYSRMLKDVQKVYPEVQKGAIDFNIASAHVYERHFDIFNKMVKYFDK